MVWAVLDTLTAAVMLTMIARKMESDCSDATKQSFEVQDCSPPPSPEEMEERKEGDVEGPAAHSCISLSS